MENLLSVVFVHGLFGHPLDTWTTTQSGTAAKHSTALPRLKQQSSRRFWAKDRQKLEDSSNSDDRILDQSPSLVQSGPIFWPKDMLPDLIPESRIYTWGYDVDINHLFSSASQATVFQHAGSLLSDLANARMIEGDKSRPIIFVAHSLGGIVVKDMLNASRNEVNYLKDILSATHGIIFLGTPHRGSPTATVGKIAQEITKTLWKHPNLSILRDLEVNSQTLDRIGRGFSQVLVERSLEIHSFREELPTKGVMVVSSFSSAIENGREIVGSIPADHKHMTKFSGPSDIGFKRVSATLARWTRNIKKQNDQSMSTRRQANMTENASREDPVSHRFLEPRNQHYYVPHELSSNYTGRDEIYQQLRENCLPSQTVNGLRKQKRFVLYGLGGSGKTQMCLRFAQNCRENFWGVFWIDASSDQRAEQGFLELARVFRIEENLEIIKRWLSNTKDRWLLIIDNADDPSIDVSRYFPTGDRGVILVTTRNPGCKIHSTVGSSEFGQMEKEEAITLLLRISDEDIVNDNSRTLGKSIVECLGCLPLAIVQAGAFMREQHCSMQEYLLDYSHSRKKLLGRRPLQASTDYKYTVCTTYEVSVEQIEKMSGESAGNAIEILGICSFLHFEGISEQIFKDGWRNMHSSACSDWLQSHQLHMPRQKEHNDWDSVLMREAFSLLLSYSLISIDSANRQRQISMHPLVHWWARQRFNEQDQKRYWMMTAATLAMSTSWQYRFKDYGMRRLLLPHVDSCLKSGTNELFLPGDGEMERFYIAFAFVQVYRESGQLEKAVELAEKTLKAAKQILGAENLNTLVAIDHLAQIYCELRRDQEAIELGEQLEEARKRILGAGDPRTIAAMRNLSVIYSSSGKLQEALKLGEVVLQIQKRTLGTEHPDALRAMHNLACIYADLGQLEKALKCGEEVLQVQKRTLGTEHPDTLRAMDHLACTYSKLGQLKEALKLGEEVLQVRKRTLGTEHPDTLRAMDNLACTYSRLDQLQEALKLREEVLQVQERTLGTEHPDALRAMHNLACIYANLGQLQEALKLGEEVLQVWKRTLGTEHPDTLRAMDNLACIYGRLDQLQEALKLEEAVVEARKRVLAPGHPDILLAEKLLAEFHIDLAREQEAKDLMKATNPMSGEEISNISEGHGSKRSLRTRMKSLLR